MLLDREDELSRGIFVETNKVTQGHGEADIFIGVEWVHPQRSLKPDHDDRETQRVQPGVEQSQIVGQRREWLVLLPSHLREMGNHFRSYFHIEAFRPSRDGLALPGQPRYRPAPNRSAPRERDRANSSLGMTYSAS
jgi:hypothetical protein